MLVNVLIVGENSESRIEQWDVPETEAPTENAEISINAE